MARLVSSVVVATLAATQAVASADVFKLYGEARGGGMYGTGLAGAQKDDAFFAKSKGGAYGAVLGGQLLIFDGHIKHHQYIKSGQLTTWTQFNAGLNFNLDTGTPADKKAFNGGYVEFGIFAGFGVGTGAQVDPPLDNSEVTDKGFVAELKLGAGFAVGKVMSVGVALPISAGYYFMSDQGTANDAGTHYQAVEAAFLVNLRLKLKVK